MMLTTSYTNQMKIRNCEYKSNKKHRKLLFWLVLFIVMIISVCSCFILYALVKLPKTVATNRTKVNSNTEQSNEDKFYSCQEEIPAKTDG